LTPEATAQVVIDRLALLFGASGAYAPAVVELLASRSEGNPLYVRELCTAAREFEVLGEDAGVGQVPHFAGTLAAQRGDYDKATRAYGESYQIRERLDDRGNMAALLSNLAIVAEDRGDYLAAQDLNERSLALRVQDGNKWAIGISQNNLGNAYRGLGEYDEARDEYARPSAPTVPMTTSGLWRSSTKTSRCSPEPSGRSSPACA